LAAGRPALAINLEYFPHVPPYSVGFEQILTVDPDPPTLVDDEGDPVSVLDFNIWRGAPFTPSLGKLEAFSSISTDITAAGSGPSDVYHVFSPSTGGLMKIEGSTLLGGIYDGENSTFTGEGIGMGPGAVSRSIWDVEIVSTGEPIGTPVRIDVVAIIQGYVSANKATHPVLPDARATWHVAANGTPVISGMETLVDGPGVVPFEEDNFLSPVTFYKKVGDTFTFELDYKLEVDGIVPMSVSTAEITGSEAIVMATVVPEPNCAILAMLGLAGATWLRRRLHFFAGS
jgi:MYXO-CTERM domain-containing protein